MKTIAALLFVMLAGQAEAITRGTVSCEQTGSCAPGSSATNTKGFATSYDATDLYSYGEQDNIK